MLQKVDAGQKAYAGTSRHKLEMLINFVEEVRIIRTRGARGKISPVAAVDIAPSPAMGNWSVHIPEREVIRFTTLAFEKWQVIWDNGRTNEHSWMKDLSI